MVWEIGAVTSSELKSLTILLQDKKGEKKEYPVVLKGILTAADKVAAEAAPVTVLASEKSVVQAVETSTPKTTLLPKKKLVSATTVDLMTPTPDATPATWKDDNTPTGGSTDAKPTPAGGN